MNRGRSIGLALVLGAQLICGSCASHDVSGPPHPDQATLPITVDLAGTAVASVVVEVAASDIPTTLVFKLPIAAGVAAGTVTISAGSSRTVVIHAYDAGGTRTHSGSATLNLQPGINGALTIVLVPETGDLPITVTLGIVRITVAPPRTTLTTGQTVQLAATIVDALGAQVTGTVRWATRNPGVADVDAAGLVTARGVGETSVFAVFAGSAGAAVITVTQ